LSLTIYIVDQVDYCLIEGLINSRIMRSIFTSDIHANGKHLSELLSIAGKNEVDGIVIGGDIVPHLLPGEKRNGPVKAQEEYLRAEFIPALKNFKDRNPGTRIFLDMANDDFIWNRRVLEERDGGLFNLLHLRVQRFTEDVDIAGYMSVPVTPFLRKDWEKPDTKEQPFPGGNISLNGYSSSTGKREKHRLNPSSEDTIESDLSLLSQKITRPFIFVSHSPPYGTDLDMLLTGEHVGSRAVRDFISRWAKDGRLLASFHGHLHESPEVSGSISAMIDGVQCINPGQGSDVLKYVFFETKGAHVSIALVPEI
jgi:Icc-related predicted phosphoesterase